MFEAALGRVKRWVAAGAAGLFCLGAYAAVPPDGPEFSLWPQPAVGEVFSLYMDPSLALAIPVGGFTTTDVIMAYDATALLLVDFGAGGLFGAGANASRVGSAVIPDFEALDGAHFIASRTSGDPGLDLGVFRFDFLVTALPLGGKVLFAVSGIGEPLLSMQPDYYAFEGRSFEVSVVPEPASVALLLAGLGVVGASAARQRRALAA